MDDIELLRRYAEDESEEAFAELVRRHVNLVYSAALRRVGDDIHLAKDVTQKVFIALARQASSVSGHRTLTGWLYTAARYSAAHTVRTEYRRKAREQKAYLMNENSSDAPSELDWDRVRPALDEVMDQLNERDREALLLRFFSGCRLSEVGLNLGLTEEAARKRVDRALEKLRSLLAKRGVNSASAAVATMLATNAVSAAPSGFAATVPGVAMAAAGAGAPAFNLLRFLGTGKTGIGVAGILGIAAIVNVPAIGAAVRELRASRRAEASLAAASQGYADQLAKLRAVETTARAADQERTALDSAPRDPKSAGRKFLAEFPEARAMLIEAGMSGDLKANGSFYRLAGFTPAQIDRFEKLMVESWVDGLAVTPEGLSGNGMPSDDQLRNVLGDDAFQKFQAYNQMMDAYRWTGIAARELGFANAPLSAGQADQLAQILANNSAIYRGDQALNRTSVDGGTAIASVDWNEALTEAKAVLSASQWKSAEPVFLNFQFEGALSRAQQAQGLNATPPAGPELEP